MKILFLDSPAFAKKDMLEAFHNCNIETDLFMHEDYNVRKSAAYDAAFDAAVENTFYDFVFPLTIIRFWPPVPIGIISVMFPMFMTVRWWLCIPLRLLIPPIIFFFSIIRFTKS